MRVNEIAYLKKKKNLANDHILCRQMKLSSYVGSELCCRNESLVGHGEWVGWEGQGAESPQQMPPALRREEPEVGAGQRDAVRIVGEGSVSLTSQAPDSAGHSAFCPASSIDADGVNEWREQPLLPDRYRHAGLLLCAPNGKRSQWALQRAASTWPSASLPWNRKTCCKDGIPCHSTWN